ncbi:Two-component response regulator [uncultured delta proteobacterium]|uniref:Two-component response regulator n=1 Tax=uncultured delta proteobacterium TaxID=34034 RepID=A0A212JLD5_9DELT|nr:Two-component response regulator [uncultured delta proteobacterium]
MSEQSRPSVLIVDDEKPNLSTLSKILNPGFTVYMAKSGETALQIAHEVEPDLILLDILMPRMDGFEVLEQLKTSEKTRDIPVIFITALDSVEDEEKGLFLGAVDYIKKPFHGSIVKARVRTQWQIVQQRRTIERLCMIDPLTELPNRRSFDAQINLEWARAIREHTPISLLIIDVDEFKHYNDTYGHQQGDSLLVVVSRIFQNSVSRPFDLVARIGGEEFAVVLSNTDKRGALEIARKICSNVCNMDIRDGSGEKFPTVTVSIGVSTAFPGVGDCVADLVASADKALYKAKGAGRNRVCD